MLAPGTINEWQPPHGRWHATTKQGIGEPTMNTTQTIEVQSETTSEYWRHYLKTWRAWTACAASTGSPRWAA
jgi:hypothetical protein